MNENIADLKSGADRDGPCGYAVKKGGVVSVRTASTTKTGARVNGLVLFYGAPAWLTCEWTGEFIEELWLRETRGQDICLVSVVCTEIQEGEVV